MTELIIVAHAPLASALRQTGLHAFADAGAHLHALDVAADDAPETTLAQLRALIAQLQVQGGADVLIMADIFGATPCNCAVRAIEGLGHVRLIAGVNVPMLYRALSYASEGVDALAQRALMGASQGAMSVSTRAPQNQNRQQIENNHDTTQHHHQQ